MYRSLVALLLLIAHGAVLAQAGKTPWEELGNRLKASQEVSALGPNLFGDQVSLSNGALSFSATDLSIPGNNALPVAFSRAYRVRDWRYRVADGMLKDWDVELPNISSVGFAAWLDSSGNQARCSVGGASPSPAAGLHPIDYWQGTNLDIPGVSSGELLRTLAGTLVPDSGGPYYWTTNDQVRISCLSTIKNGTGQGFLAIAPDGTKYWFDWMARHAEPVLKHVDAIFNPGGAPFIQYHPRYRHVLYVSRVEDRFGNWVSYTYTNNATQPGKLTQITSNDGRSITINYSGSTVLSVSDGARTWSYGYGSTSSGRGTLTTVTQPDGKVWSIDFAEFTNAEIQTLEYRPFDEELRTCIHLETPQNYDSEPVGTMTHPSGATGSFRLSIKEHGRSNVPLNCRNVTTEVGQPNGSGNDRNDDTPLYPISAYAFTLMRKTISGVGMSPVEWNYQYASNVSHIKHPGTTLQYPVCTLGTVQCQQPVCVDDTCAGSSATTVTGPDGEWVRHRYGNSYLYNEGKLVSVEVGSGSTSSEPLRKTTHAYDLTLSDGPYKARWGTGYRAYGDSFQSEYHRPLVKSEIEQDGSLFVWEVPKGCSVAYPASYCMDSLARPVRVVRSGTVSTAATGENPVIAPSLVPTLTLPASSSTGSYSAGWTAVPLASSYQLREMLGTGSWSTIHSGSATSKAVSGRATGSWNYQVRACNVVGCGAWSGTRTTIVTLPPAGAPTLTAPASNTTGSYTVSWTAVGGATRYELDQRKDAGAWSKIHDAAATSKALTGQTPGTYGHRVRACNAGGCSPYSAISNTTVTSQPLGAPSLTAPATVYAGDAFTVSWTNIGGATQYVLERNRNGGAFVTVYDGAATSTSQTAGLLGTYRYRVKACNSGGCGPLSGDRIVTVEGGSLMQGQDPEALGSEGDAGEGGE